MSTVVVRTGAEDYAKNNAMIADGPPRAGRAWTAEDEAAIRAGGNEEETALHLGRTIIAVRDRASLLGVLHLFTHWKYGTPLAGPRAPEDQSEVVVPSYSRLGSRWEEADDVALVGSEGETDAAVAARMGRSPGAIRSRRKVLGLLKPAHAISSVPAVDASNSSRLIAESQLAERWEITAVQLDEMLSNGLGPDYLQLPDGRRVFEVDLVEQFEQMIEDAKSRRVKVGAL